MVPIFEMSLWTQSVLQNLSKVIHFETKMWWAKICNDKQIYFWPARMVCINTASSEQNFHFKLFGWWFLNFPLTTKRHNDKCQKYNIKITIFADLFDKTWSISRWWFILCICPHHVKKPCAQKKKIINKPRYDIVYLYTILNFYRAFISSLSPNRGKEGKSPAGYK